MKSTTTNRKPGSIGLSQIHNFSNYNPSMKSRTQYVTPHTLSPPPEPNIIKPNNSIYKSGLQSRKSQNENYQTNENGSQNYPHSQNGKKKEVFDQKRQFVSMEEMIGYLTYLNNQPVDAFKADNIPLQEISQLKKNAEKKNGSFKLPQFGRKKSSQSFGGGFQKSTLTVPKNTKVQRNGTQQTGSDDGSQITDTKKKLNKNRAIKRIIETAFDLLQKNYHATDSGNVLTDNQRSTSTQFNIYLKQYNRIIEQINSKQAQQQLKFNHLQDLNEEQLQQVFEYTVMDDFRQKLSVMFTKQKVSKNNVNIMISAFRDALVMLKLNEMKVEFTNSDEPVKTFKMSEIQNVEYFTHPYIFIVLTINKDKNKSKEHLYLKFSSQENQNKWDRALYCCYMTRKMTKKEKLFEIEYPVEDVMKKQKEEFKKQDQEYIFEQSDDLYIVDKCYKQAPDTNSLASNYPTYDVDGERNLISDRSQYMNNMTKNRNLTEEKITISINNPDSVEDARKLNTVQNKSSKYDNPFKTSDANNTNPKLPKDQLTTTNNNNQPTTNIKKTNSFTNDKIDNQEQPVSVINPTVKKQPTIFMPDDQQQNTFNLNPNQSPQKQQPTNSNINNKNTASSPFSSILGPQSPFNNTSSTNPFMRLLKVTQQKAQKNSEQQQNKKKPTQTPPSHEQMLRKNTLVNDRINKMKRIREIQKNNVRGIVCQKERFFMNKQKILFFHDQNIISSARKNENELIFLQSIKNISSKEYQTNKYLQYWDYDYKKDLKECRKLISVNYIIDYQLMPSQLGQTTSTIIVGYSLPVVAGNNNTDGKVERKQLRLIFANAFSAGSSTGGQMNNPNNLQINKGDQVFQWIRLVKGV